MPTRSSHCKDGGKEIGQGGESGKKLRFQLRAAKSLSSLQVSHNVYQIQSVIKGHFFPRPQPSNCYTKSRGHSSGERKAAHPRPQRAFTSSLKSWPRCPVAKGRWTRIQKLKEMQFFVPNQKWVGFSLTKALSLSNKKTPQTKLLLRGLFRVLSLRWPWLSTWGLGVAPFMTISSLICLWLTIVQAWVGLSSFWPVCQRISWPLSFEIFSFITMESCKTHCAVSCFVFLLRNALGVTVPMLVQGH